MAQSADEGLLQQVRRVDRARFAPEVDEKPTTVALEKLAHGAPQGRIEHFAPTMAD